jgi:hypothetical protein
MHSRLRGIGPDPADLDFANTASGWGRPALFYSRLGCARPDRFIEERGETAA